MSTPTQRQVEERFVQLWRDNVPQRYVPTPVELDALDAYIMMCLRYNYASKGNDALFKIKDAIDVVSAHVPLDDYINYVSSIGLGLSHSDLADIHSVAYSAGQKTILNSYFGGYTDFTDLRQRDKGGAPALHGPATHAAVQFPF